jgi:hypothetical protein
MPEGGGWCIIIESGAGTRMFVVANSDHQEAEKLVLAYARGGEVIMSPRSRKVELPP